MRGANGIYRLFQLVQSGDPLGIGIAVVIGLAVVGIVVLALRQRRASRSPIAQPTKKFRWPKDAPKSDPSDRN